MSQYLLLTDLRAPAKVRSQLAATMVGIATVSDVIPDSVRVEFVENIDLSNKSDLDRIVHLVMQAVNDCGESAAMGGLFTD